MPNQYKPLPPDDELRVWGEYYWDLGLPDTKIVEMLQQHFDNNLYGLSVWSFRKLRKRWGLLNTRKQKHTEESIAASVAVIKQNFPNMGARMMVVTLRQDYGIRVPEAIVAKHLKVIEPEAVAQRKGRNFKRRVFYAAGVNDVWAVDQHDKWQRFGLYLHVGVDPFAGDILWLRIWWTNRNPRLIASYYLDAAKRRGGVCLVTQSDPGTENYGIANCHTTIRHRLDHTLTGTLQHRFMRHKSNIKPEIMWSIVRRTWSEGFEMVLQYGILQGFYDPTNTIEKLVFLWLAVPWLQAELDRFARRFNTSARRRDKHKVTPQGIPELIASRPEDYNARDYKIVTSDQLLDAMSEQWAPRTDPVFQLTPPEFDYVARYEYALMGSPAVNSASFWEVYLSLLQAIHRDPDSLDVSDVPQSEARVEAEHSRTADNAPMPLLPGLQQLRMGQEVAGPQVATYIGGLVEPPSPFRHTLQADAGTEQMGEENEWEEDIDLEGGDESGEDDEDEQLYAPLTDFRDDV